MKQLNSLVKSIPDFTKLTHADKVRFLAWYLHTHEKREKFKVQEIGTCYDLLNLERPKNLNRTVDALTETRPKQLMRTAAGYSLVRAIREEYDGKYGERGTTVEVTKLLVDLQAKLSDLAESTFLSETLICLKHGAFRATIVMCWNLAYSHFCNWLLSKHSGPFNTQWPLRYPDLYKRARIKSIGTLSDFSELKESEVIEIARSAGLISGNIQKILTEKLTKRNMAAHPSTVLISHLQAEECVYDLINNVVLQLS